MVQMDAKLAYRAMFRFLENYWERGRRTDEDIAALLGSMSLDTFSGDEPADAAMWDDWLEAIDQVMAAQERRFDDQSKGSAT